MLKNKIMSKLLYGFCALALFNGAPVNAQNSVQIQSFAPLAKRLLPSVVGIKASSNTFMGHHPTFANAPVATGSGFVVNKQGYVVTNNHVIEMGDSFQISLQDGEIVPARLIGRDTETDLAVLQIASNVRPPFLAFADSDKVNIGDWAIAIGSPFGLGNSFSVGVISGRNRDLQSGKYDNFLQTDAAINPGNSGGPLFDENGNVIGVNTAIVSGQQTGGSVGVGFAIPANSVRRIVDDIIKYGYVRRGYAGFRARYPNGNEGQGVIISAIADDGPAKVAGIRVNDRYFAINGRNIMDPRFLARAIADAKIGDTVRLDGYRGSQRIYANVKIGLAPSIAGQNPTGTNIPAKTAGISIRMMSPQERIKYGSGANIIISQIDSFSPAKNNLMVGDAILEIDGQKINTPAQARALIDTGRKSRGIILVKIKRGNSIILKAVR